MLQNKQYNYAELVMPQDAANKHMAAKKSVSDRFKEYGYKVRVLDGRTHQDIQGQINASRALLPRCYFDEIKCERGLNALRSYRKEYNDKLRRFNENPLHDWASDGATAFNTGAMMPEKPKRKGASPQPKVPVY